MLRNVQNKFLFLIRNQNYFRRVVPLTRTSSDKLFRGYILSVISIDQNPSPSRAAKLRQNWIFSGSRSEMSIIGMRYQGTKVRRRSWKQTHEAQRG